MPGSIHGGDIYAYEREYGEKPLDFSSNINPLKMPKGVLAALCEAAIHADCYPDPNSVDLCRELSQFEQVPQEWFSKLQIFHLRGALDYKILKPSHRILMSLLYHRIKKQDAEILSAEDRAFLETYQKKVDFVDWNQLEPVLKQIQNEL